MEIHTDFLVLGTGIAGLSFAIKAAELGTVAMVTKKNKTDSNTNMAQGGIAVVQDQTDRFEYHINDTLTCGAGLLQRRGRPFRGDGGSGEDPRTGAMGR